MDKISTAFFSLIIYGIAIVIVIGSAIITDEMFDLSSGMEWFTPFQTFLMVSGHFCLSCIGGGVTIVIISIMYSGSRKSIFIFSGISGLISSVYLMVSGILGGYNELIILNGFLIPVLVLLAFISWITFVENKSKKEQTN